MTTHDREKRKFWLNAVGVIGGNGEAVTPRSFQFSWDDRRQDLAWASIESLEIFPQAPVAGNDTEAVTFTLLRNRNPQDPLFEISYNPLSPPGVIAAGLSFAPIIIGPDGISVKWTGSPGQYVRCELTGFRKASE